MARRITFFVGPYVLWRVPVEEWNVRWKRDEALYVEVLDGTALSWTGMDWRDVVEEGRRFRPFYGFPRESRPGAPRAMVWETDGSWELQPWPAPTDWARLDRRAEVRWFRSAFAAELGRAAELFGGRPTFRWGLVVDTVP